MSLRRKYYSGDGGVFYGPRKDYIFELKRIEGMSVYSRKNGGEAGGLYHLRFEGKKYRAVAVSGVEEAIRLEPADWLTDSRKLSKRRPG